MSPQTNSVSIKIDEVIRRTTLSRTTIYRRLKEERDNPVFPRPRKIGANRVVWLEHEVEEFIQSCICH